MRKQKISFQKRRATLAAAAALPLLGLSACGGSTTNTSTPAPTPTPTPTPGTQAKTTFLVYMVASDLETNHGAATFNIKQMLAATPSTDVQVVYQTGGSTAPGFQTGIRWLLQNQQATQLQSLGQVDMGQAQTLSDFIKWGVGAYPADQYMLVLWNHGSGPIRGFGLDEVSKNIIPGPQVISAVQGAAASMGVSFELLGFDACLMANIEMAAGLAPCARYMVASQETEPGSGWNYTTILNTLAATPTVTGDVLGRTIVDSYYVQNSENTDVNRLTLSVTNLQKIGPVVTALGQLSQQWRSVIASQGVSAWAPLAGARSQTDAFGSTRLPMPGQVEIIDLGRLIENPMSESGATGQALSTALSQAVVYMKNGEGHADATGLTVYFPARDIVQPMDEGPQTVAQKYVADNIVPAYASFVAEYAAFAQSAPSLAPVVTPLAAAAGNTYAASFSNGWGSTGQFAVLLYPEGTTITSTLPLTPDGDGVLSVPTRPSWPTVGGQPVLLQPEWTPDKNSPGQYSIPVMFTPRGGSSSDLLSGLLRLQWDNVTNVVVFQDLVPIDDTAVPVVARGIPVSDLVNQVQTIWPQQYLTTNNGGPANQLGQPLNFTSGLTLTFVPVEAGNYLVTVCVADFANRWTFAAGALPVT